MDSEDFEVTMKSVDGKDKISFSVKKELSVTDAEVLSMKLTNAVKFLRKSSFSVSERRHNASRERLNELVSRLQELKKKGKTRKEAGKMVKPEFTDVSTPTISRYLAETYPEKVK